MPTDPNQKLIAQIADLSRNLGTLTDSVKKNTVVTQDLSESSDKLNFDKISGALEPLKDLTKITDALKGLDLKELSKNLGDLTGPNSPLSNIGEIKDMIGKINPAEIMGAFEKGGNVNKTGE